MLTLHGATDLTKQVLKWIGIVLAGLIALYILFRLGKAIKDTFFPTPPPPPTVDFGQIPPITFPQSDVTQSLSYDSQFGTVTGFLPALPDRMKVYKMETYTPSLLDYQNAKQKIAGVGFASSYDFILPEVSLGNSKYEWSDNSPLARKITMDTTTNDFVLTSSYLTSPDVVNAPYAPSVDDSKKAVDSFLQSMALYPDDVDTTKTQTQYLKLQGDRLIGAISQSDGRLTRVDLFQNDLDGKPVIDKQIPIYYPKPANSTMNFIVFNQGGQAVVAEAAYYHQKVLTDTSGTYPIKTALQAFDDLKRGNAYIAAYYGTANTVKISDAKLGYYLGRKKVPYLMPIIVFSGNDGFIAYVSAVKGSWISNPQ